MAIQLSPSVAVREVDLTNVIPAVQTSVAAAVIAASWGPVLDVTSIDSENTLVNRFGKPNSSNFENWLNLANFLGYSANALVVRADTTGQYNAVAIPTGRVSSITLTGTQTGTYLSNTTTVTIEAPAAGGLQATAIAVVETGEIVGITITEPGFGYTSAPTVTITGAGAGAVGTAVITQGGIKINNLAEYEEKYAYGGGIVGGFAAKYPGSIGDSLEVQMADASSFSAWAYKSLFSLKPGTSEAASRVGASNDELHVVVIDKTGKWSGTVGTVLEQYAFLSKATGVKKSDGTQAYYANAINNQSQYVYWMDHPATGTNWGSDPAPGTVYATAGASSYVSTLTGGADDFTPTLGQLSNAFAMFTNGEQYDVSLVLQGAAERELARYIIDNVAEARKDCIAFVSPQKASGGPIIGTNSDAVEAMLLYKNGDGNLVTSLPSSSYVVYDSGFKYQYDRYNDVYRWVPLNGDVAGLCARTDYTDDPWFSPAGFNRGQVKNVVRLGYNPRKADRDTLYVNGINPVVSFPGQGVVLYGDKTGLAKPSAFDRINVRRLFITLEKAISTSAKYQLFEFNDSFTRANFRNQVEPFLRDVKGRRGITDFKVVVDETNNTPEVIDTNRFVASIFIKPARSINFVQLDFVATRTGASFEEIAG